MQAAALRDFDTGSRNQSPLSQVLASLKHKVFQGSFWPVPLGRRLNVSLLVLLLLRPLQLRRLLIPVSTCAPLPALLQHH